MYVTHNDVCVHTCAHSHSHTCLFDSHTLVCVSVRGTVCACAWACVTLASTNDDVCTHSPSHTHKKQVCVCVKDCVCTYIIARRRERTSGTDEHCSTAFCVHTCTRVNYGVMYVYSHGWPLRNFHIQKLGLKFWCTPRYMSTITLCTHTAGMKKLA